MLNTEIFFDRVGLNKERTGKQWFTPYGIISIIYRCLLLQAIPVLVCLWLSAGLQSPAYTILPIQGSNAFPKQWPSNASATYYGDVFNIQSPGGWFQNSPGWQVFQRYGICPMAATSISGSGATRIAIRDYCITWNEDNVFAMIDEENKYAGFSSNLQTSANNLISAYPAIFAAAALMTSSMVLFSILSLAKYVLPCLHEQEETEIKALIQKLGIFTLFSGIISLILIINAYYLIYINNDIGNMKSWSTTLFSSCVSVEVTEGNTKGYLVYSALVLGVALGFLIFVDVLLYLEKCATASMGAGYAAMNMNTNISNANKNPAV